MVCGKYEAVQLAKEQFKKHVDTDEQGEWKEYVGCKVERDWNKRCIRFTQPVMILSFRDEFDLPKESPPNPAKEHYVKKMGVNRSVLHARLDIELVSDS